jgi:hygromycin-B 7''-O-kinase
MGKSALPRDITPAGLDALQADPARWLATVAALAAPYSRGEVRPAASSTVLVGLADDAVVKLYPPFLRDHFAYEHAALRHLHGRLSLPTPRLLADGELEGWPWLVMTRLPGRPLNGLWTTLPEAQRLALVTRVGALAAELHALPVAPMHAVAPPWPQFLQRQREGCESRQRRTGLPLPLLAQLPAFLQGPVPEGPEVMLTGEFTPFNLLVDANGTLRGMIDFGDGLVGPREYDWLGPMCFYAAGQPARLDAFFAGYGLPTPRHRCEELLRLLLLHRYSALPAQLQFDGWMALDSLAAVARRAWG